MSTRSPRLLAGLTLLALLAPVAATTGPAGAAVGSAAPAVRQAGADADAERAVAKRYRVPVVKAHPRNPSNPLAGREWGVYRGDQEPTWGPYRRATGANKDRLAEIALRPKARWFTRGRTPAQLRAQVRDYVRVSQDGNPNALVQLALFGMRPWGEEICRRGPNAAEQRAYKNWITGAARGIGDAHAAVVLQPDLMVARCGPGGGAKVADLVRFATRTLAAKPHTSVYIDAGAYDWPPPSRGGAGSAVDYLVRAGIRSARGFSLNGTHYSPLRLEVTRAGEIARALEKRGIRGKRAVISTTSNGKGFEFGRYNPQSSRDNARTCRSKTDKRMCVMMGAPPSMDPDATRWGLSAKLRGVAARHVDGYVWFGRPWLYNQATPFQHQRAYDLVRSWRLKPR